MTGRAWFLPALAVALFVGCERSGPELRCCEPQVLLREDDLPAVAAAVARIWEGRAAGAPGDLPARLRAPAPGLSVAVRAGGLRLAEGWESGETVVAALGRLLPRLREEMGEEQARQVDVLEMNLAHSFRRIDLRNEIDLRKLRANVRRGIDGFEIRHGEDVLRVPPTLVVATNRRPAKWIETFAADRGVTPEALRKEARARMFAAEQLLVEVGDSPRARLLYRGNEIVPAGAVDEASVRRTADLAIEWLRNNLHLDGRMTYLYWPSRLEEAPGNNMIRQWMATIALGRAAAARGDAALAARSARNISYNLGRFYHEEDGLGVIEWNGKAKLGAVALAALAIVEHPERERWRREEEALRRTVDHLRTGDGSFRTFLRPPERTDNQNFYPGEALLLWATLIARDDVEGLLEPFLESFGIYRQWHLHPDNRNPAFVPWHTQADFLVWEKTGDPALASFILEMNDWLLGVQQWNEDARWPDTNGRFYDPSRPFGPPHASSTGVYLEGLIDAWELARRLGQKARAERYRLAIVRGLRSVMQLQFADGVDLFYVGDKERDRVRGGIRTTVYDNRIRCDNVQHNLMAMLKILERFGPEDYDPEPRPAAGRYEFKVKRNPEFFLRH